VQEAVLVDLSDGVMTLTLNRPTKRNAINGAVLEGLASALERAKADSGTRVVVVGGAGGYFSAGIDLSFAVDSKMPRLDFMRMVGDVVVALHELRVPTVSVVEGGAYGLGCNIALACDLTIATDDAVFCEVFSRLGFVIDGGGSWLLPRLVGLKKAKELTFFADKIPARDAERMGLVNCVVRRDELEELVVSGLAQQGWLGSPGLRLAGGTDEILHNIVAERVLGLPGEVRVDKDKAFQDIPSGTVR
jgi:2-(1,2-epoxy-1,2-dihydrophenyl)acetyl-CoA isomerase